MTKGGFYTRAKSLTPGTGVELVATRHAGDPFRDGRRLRRN